jgi:hypothetical protein
LANPFLFQLLAFTRGWQSSVTIKRIPHETYR